VANIALPIFVFAYLHSNIDYGDDFDILADYLDDFEVFMAEVARLLYDS
jgi:hypothetical protein